MTAHAPEATVARPHASPRAARRAASASGERVDHPVDVIGVDGVHPAVQQLGEHAGELGVPTEALQAEPVEQRGEPRSEEHTSELQSLMRISYAVFCLKKKNRRDLREML